MVFNVVISLYAKGGIIYREKNNTVCHFSDQYVLVHVGNDSSKLSRPMDIFCFL